MKAPMKAARPALGLVPALLVVGCGSGIAGGLPPPTAPGSTFEVPGAADAAQRAADDHDLSAPALERAAFVRAVLDRNPSIESARQAWRSAAARVREAGALEDPMVTVDAAPLTLAAKTRFAWDVALSQKVPWPGKLALDEAIAGAEADAARSDLEAARRDLALTAALLFDQYFVSARSIGVNAHHVDLMRGMRAAAAAQLETGHGGAQDPLQAEFELAHMEHDTVTLASQRDVIVAQMNELLHRSPDAPLPPPPPALPAAPADVRDTAHLEREAAERRPEIAAARTRARAEQARADRAARESYPDVTLSTAYNAMWDVPGQRWTVGLSFNLPVQLGRRAGAVDEARATRARFESDAAGLTDAARTQVFVALKELEEAEHVLRLYEQRLVPVARDEVDAARAAYAASQSPFIALVDAERNLRSVELEKEKASADLDGRVAALDHALGRVPGLGEKGASR